MVEQTQQGDRTLIVHDSKCRTHAIFSQFSSKYSLYYFLFQTDAESLYMKINAVQADILVSNKIPVLHSEYMLGLLLVALTCLYSARSCVCVCANITLSR